MRVVIYILMVLCALLVVLCYALCVMAHEADERAERMYRKWKEQLQKDIVENGESFDSDYNLGINHAMCVLGAMKGADDE